MHETEKNREARPEGRGRSAQKRAARAIERLAQQLAEMPASRLEALPMAAELAGEVALARKTRGHGSRKRQIKHLAGYLRRHDDQRSTLEAALAGQAIVERQEVLALHQLEAWRDQLCEPSTCEAAMDEVRQRYPQLDAQKLGRLARAVHNGGDKKAAREIFRRLRQAAESAQE